MIGFILMFIAMLCIVGYGQYLIALTFFHNGFIAIGLFLLMFSPMWISRCKVPFSVEKIVNYIGYIYMGSNLYLIPMVFIHSIFAFPVYFYLIPLFIVIYGIYNCRHIIIKEYNIEAPFNADIALISDIHLGYQIGAKQFQKMIDKVNSVKADYVFIAGDLCDMNFDVVIKQDLFSMLDSINGPVYMIMGNHDNYTNKIKELKEEVGKTKVILLDDEVIHLDQFTIIGRNDAQMSKKTLDDFEFGNYNIVMDHTPSRIQESVDHKVDLHLSGHTHNGQLWPLQLVTNHIFKVGYGYKKFASTNVVVSGGIGYWGPMNKSSGPCEVTLLKLKKPD